MLPSIKGEYSSQLEEYNQMRQLLNHTDRQSLVDLEKKFVDVISKIEKQNTVWFFLHKARIQNEAIFLKRARGAECSGYVRRCAEGDSSRGFRDREPRPPVTLFRRSEVSFVDVLSPDDLPLEPASAVQYYTEKLSKLREQKEQLVGQLNCIYAETETRLTEIAQKIQQDGVAAVIPNPTAEELEILSVLFNDAESPPSSSFP